MGKLICTDLKAVKGGFTLDVPALTIAPGEKIAVLGENGCGKTTLLQVLAGLQPAQGSIMRDAALWDRLSPAERAAHMAYLPQEAGVLFNLSVAEIADLALRRDDLLEGGARRAALDAVEMADFLDRPYPSLSGGEQRRAMLARVLCRKADFLFLDEPTAPLDMRHAALFMRHAAAIPPAVVAAMHDLNLAVRYFDRFLLMKNGRILFDTRKDQLDAGDLETVYGIGLARCGDHFVPDR